MGPLFNGMGLKKVGATLRPKRTQTRIKIDFWPYKLAKRAYFGLEGVDEGWTTNYKIQTDQLGPFVSTRMSQVWPYRDQK